MVPLRCTCSCFVLGFLAIFTEVHPGGALTVRRPVSDRSYILHHTCCPTTNDQLCCLAGVLSLAAEQATRAHTQPNTPTTHATTTRNTELHGPALQPGLRPLTCRWIFKITSQPCNFAQSTAVPASRARLLCQSHLPTNPRLRHPIRSRSAVAITGADRRHQVEETSFTAECATVRGFGQLVSNHVLFL